MKDKRVNPGRLLRRDQRVRRSCEVNKILAAGLLLLLFSCLFSSSVWSKKYQRPLKIIAHRGAHKYAPENSLSSIMIAIEMKLDYVEVDVRTTKDGVLVLMHNSTVDDRTTSTGQVRCLTWDEISKLKLKGFLGVTYKDITVPSLEEALKLMSGKIGIYVDMKNADYKKVAELLKKYNMIEDAVVYGDWATLERFTKLKMGIQVMPTISDLAQLKFLRLILPKFIEADEENLRKEFVDAIHQFGAKVYMDLLGKADNEKSYKKAIELGVDGIQTDYPDKILNLLGEKFKIKTKLKR